MSYYGVGIEKALNEVSHLASRVVLLMAGEDRFCLPEMRDEIEQALASRVSVELCTYPGVDHAFARAGSGHWDKAAALAHQRSATALRETLDETGARSSSAAERTATA